MSIFVDSRLAPQQQMLVSTAEAMYGCIEDHPVAQDYILDINPDTVHQEPYCTFHTGVTSQSILWRAINTPHLPDLLAIEVYEFRVSRLQVVREKLRFTTGREVGKLFHRNMGFLFDEADDVFIVDGMWQQFLDVPLRDPEFPRVVHGSRDEVLNAVTSYGVSEKWLPFLAASHVIDRQEISRA